ncbi:hypothetical protein [Oerskovia flava]|uniref:hypothetical protein n=1 Tax=Oerskovia flava TaxID=2986422 RepID=UPI00223EF196|nr:hypothetical protein [Oerskovia sp. JB1-3-2]
MELLPTLPSGTRVLDLGAPDDAVADHLREQGLERYLGLVPPALLDQARRASDDGGARLHPLPTGTVADRCSTDLLILRANHSRVLWSVRDLGHLRYLAVERPVGIGGVETRVAALVGRRAGRLLQRTRVQWAGTAFDLYRLPEPHGPAPRTYFSPLWGASGLALRLKEAGLRYAILRWFEALPRIEPGEDLDVLVADADVASLRTLVESEPGTMPLDLYSVSGLSASDYQGAAYYPPHLAEQILDRAVVHPSGFLVPAPDDHLHSLAYHAVYHKGERSGLPSRGLGSAVPDPEHDYRAVLQDLAAANSRTVPEVFEDLDAYLADNGWRPPTDALRRLASANPWAAGLLGVERTVDLDGAELAVFLVREATLSALDPQEVDTLLEHFGFDVITSHDLDDDARARAAQALRGGNWGRGPFPQSGGPPVRLVVALHYSPLPPYEWLRERYPHLTSSETYEAKSAIRQLVEERVPEAEHFNPLHSSDSPAEAWEYLEVVAPGDIDRVRTEAARRVAQHRAPDGTIKNLSRGRRARVDVVAGARGLLVRKTFAPPFGRFLEREVAALRDLAGRVDAVPPLVDAGPDWFECPFYEDSLGQHTGRLLPLAVVRSMVAVLRELHGLGYDLVDAKPTNFVLDHQRGLKIVDFEFLHRYEGDPPPFARSANFVGPWPGFTGDVPVGDMSYTSRWYAATGLPREVLTEGSLAMQHLHRAGFRLRSLTVLPGAPPRRLVRRSRAAARHARWLATSAYTTWARQRAGSTDGRGAR